MSTFPFADMLPRVARHFAAWEIFGEGRQYLETIEQEFHRLTPSYDLHYSAHLPISDINVASFHPEVRALSRKILRRGLEAAGRMGIGRVTMHPGLRMPMARWDDDRLRALTLEAARELAHTGADLGVEVCLENMARNWVMTFQEPEWFGAAFDDGLRFCFDVAHAHTMGRDVVDAYTREFAAFTGNVHVSDNDGGLDSHWVLGKGTVPFAHVAKGLEAAGYRGRYVIESNTLEEGVESLPQMVAALAAAEVTASPARP